MSELFVLSIVVGSIGGIALLIFMQIARNKRKWELLKKNTLELQSEDILELQVTTHLSERKIRGLYYRYKELDSDDSGTITAAEFCTMKEMAVNPLSYRIFDAFDKNNVSYYLISNYSFDQHLVIFRKRHYTNSLINYIYMTIYSSNIHIEILF